MGSSIRRRRGEITEVLLRQVDKLLVRYSASSDQYHSISSVVLFDVVDEVISLDTGDVFLWPQYCPS